MVKDETLNLGLDDLSLAHKLAIRRVKANGLHLDRELKPYLQCIVGEIANAFSEGRHHQYKVDRARMCEDRASVAHPENCVCAMCLHKREFPKAQNPER